MPHSVLHDWQPLLWHVLVWHADHCFSNLGLPAGFLTTWIVSLLTEPPSQNVQDLVGSVRYPRTGQAYRGDPLARHTGRPLGITREATAPGLPCGSPLIPCR